MRNGEHLTNASTLRGWHKSSYSGPGNGDCLEIIRAYPGGVPARDSKNPTGPALVFSSSAWSAFVASVRNCP